MLRHIAIRSPRYHLRDLMNLDKRLDANLDGLRLAGEAAWQLCQGLPETEGLAGIFTASVLAFSGNIEEQRRRILQAALGSPQLARGVISALGWLDFTQSELQIERLLAEQAAGLRLIAISAAVIHRKCRPERVLDAIRHNDALVRARGLRAIGELGLRDLVPYAAELLDSNDDQVRFSAAWSCALLRGDGGAITVLRRVAESESPFRAAALEIATRCSDPSAAKQWQRLLSANPKYARLAILAAGAMGDLELIPWLIEQMSQPESARIAGDAFAMITGLDIEKERLDHRDPAFLEAAANGNSKNHYVVMDEDEGLSWPDPSLIRTWWQRKQRDFQAGARYIFGEPITADSLTRVLVLGHQRQRSAAALELAILQRDQPLFNVAAPSSRQTALLRRHPDRPDGIRAVQESFRVPLMPRR